MATNTSSATGKTSRTASNSTGGAGKFSDPRHQKLIADYKSKLKAGTITANELRRLNVMTGGSYKSDVNNAYKGPREDNYAGTTADQDRILNQREQGDIALGDMANNRIADISGQMSSPYDTSRFYQGLPTTADQMDPYRQKYEDQAMAEFERMNGKQFDQQRQQLEQRLVERGIPVGSDLYNQQMRELNDQQQGMRSAASWQARQGSVSDAQNFYNMGKQMGDVGSAVYKDNRYGGLSDVNALRGNIDYSTPGAFAQAGQQYGYESSLAKQQFEQNRILQKEAPRGGGGGGSDPYAGFGSAQAYWAAQDERNRANQAWEWANNPQYNKKTPGTNWAGIGGGILAAVGQGAASGYFSK